MAVNLGLKFKFKSSFSTWLYQIAVNHIKDYLRKESRVKKVALKEIMEETQIKEDDQFKQEKKQLDEQRIRLIHKAIQSLPEKFQVILTLRDIQGLSYEEITRILNLPPGTVDSRIFRARRALRNKVSTFLNPEGGKNEM